MKPIQIFQNFGIVPLLAAFLAFAPTLAQMGVLTEFHINLLTYGMVFGLAGLAFNILLGYGGLLSFGHAAYFAVGAYTVATLYRYLRIENLEVLIAAAILTSLVVSAFFGLVATRFTRIFFAIMSLALTQIVWATTLKIYWFTGGSDGIRVPHMALLGIEFQKTMARPEYLSSVFYYYTLGVFIAAVLLVWLILHSPFGRTLQATRDNEVRAEFIGIPVRRYRWIAFTISGTFTGLAGALFAVLNGHVTPEISNWIFSGNIVFLTLLGGFRTFDGPLIGAILFIFIRQYAMGYTIYWELVLGAILITMVLIFSRGIMGTLYQYLGIAPGMTSLKTPSIAIKANIPTRSLKKGG